MFTVTRSDQSDRPRLTHERAYVLAGGPTACVLHDVAGVSYLRSATAGLFRAEDRPYLFQQGSNPGLSCRLV